MHLVFAIHGILTRQTSASWPDAFLAWCAHHWPEARVLKREYVAWPLPAINTWILNHLWARECVVEVDNFLRENPGTNISFVAHSNGTDIALKAIQALVRRGIRVRGFVAVGSVLDSDVNENGIAKLHGYGELRSAIAYSSKFDQAIRLGRLTTYGDLGVNGWTLAGFPFRHASAGTDNLIATRWFQWGHGGYFNDENREAVFAQIKEDLCR